jgi:predicted nucleic acid-binding protein
VIVADTNLVSYLLIEGERTEQARRIWQRDPAWILPPLWRSEFLNVLALSVRATVLSTEQARASWQHAASLFRSSEVEPEGPAVLDAALRLGISAYDAHFVVVAERLGVKLVTHDRELLDLCPDRTVSMRQFARGA